MNPTLEVITPEVNIPAAVSAEQTIGQIAVQVPGATAVFRRLKIDFCCGGNVSLGKAAADKMLDLDLVLAELSSLCHSEPLTTEVEPSALIDHILTRYHDVHREQLPELIRMARRVEAVHRDNPKVPKGLTELLEGIEHELTSHMHKEEEILFPLMRAGGDSAIGQPIALMRHEHDGHALMLDCVMALTDEATPPVGACNTWRALYGGIAQLNNELVDHIHLENNVLFPQFEAPRAPSSQAPQGCGSGKCGCS